MKKWTTLLVGGAILLLIGGGYIYFNQNDSNFYKIDKSILMADRPSPVIGSHFQQPVTGSGSSEEQISPQPLSADDVIQTIAAMPLGSEMESLCGAFGRRMALEDPGKFWKWVNQLNVAAAANSAIVAFGGTLAGKNPTAFWDLIKGQKPGANEQLLANVFSAAVAYSDPSQALEMANRLSKDDSPLAVEFRKGVLRGASDSTTPEKVADIFIATPPEQNVALYDGFNLIKAIHQKNNENLAFNTLMRLPEGEYRASVAEYYLTEIANEDPNVAGELVNRMPPGKTRDYSVGRMLNALMNRDPDAAVTWAEATDDKKLRDSRIEDLRQYYEHNNPSAFASINIKHPPLSLENSNKNE